MKVVSFIEDKDVIEKILKHLGIWLVKKKPSARANAPPVHICLDYSACPPRPETGTGSGGATRLPIVGLDYALFQTWLFENIERVIGLGQGFSDPT